MRRGRPCAPRLTAFCSSLTTASRSSPVRVSTIHSLGSACVGSSPCCPTVPARPHPKILTPSILHELLMCAVRQDCLEGHHQPQIKAHSGGPGSAARSDLPSTGGHDGTLRNEPSTCWCAVVDALAKRGRVAPAEALAHERLQLLRVQLLMRLHRPMFINCLEGSSCPVCPSTGNQRPSTCTYPASILPPLVTTLVPP